MIPSDSSLRKPVGAGSLLVLLTVVATLPLAYIATAKPSWFLFSFEVIMPVPAILGILYALGRWKDDSGLGLACVAGTILFGSVLGYVSVPQGMLGTPDGPVGELPVKWLVLVRLVATVLIAWSAVRIGLRGEAARWRAFLWGSFHSVIALGIMGGIYKFRNAPWMKSQEGNDEWIRMGVIGALSVVTLICLCAGTHYLVKAFDPGDPPRSTPLEDPSRQASAATSPGTAQTA
ncbi:MAG TPA: hypothetical protein VK176_15885 [Phycisphaerales bacterium]|nr:hypothetical protein [Phycisphaerales bacterium]